MLQVNCFKLAILFQQVMTVSVNGIVPSGIHSPKMNRGLVRIHPEAGTMYYFKYNVLQ